MITFLVRDDHEGAPRPVVARDRDRDSAIPDRRIAEAGVAIALDGSQIARDCAIDCGSQRAVRARQVGEAIGRSGRARDEALTAELVDRRRPELTTLADDQDRLAQDFVERPGIGRDPTEGRHRDEVRPAPKAIAIDRAARRLRRAIGNSGATPCMTARRVLEPGRGLRQTLGRRQESLQVAHPVATVAARVDPVVAQAPGIAPGAHRVRMDTEEAGSLRHREGGIDRTGRKRARHRLLMEEMSSRRPQPTNLTLLANRTKVPALVRRRRERPRTWFRDAPRGGRTRKRRGLSDALG